MRLKYENSICKSESYFVSDGGFIAHYNGTIWQQIESETDSNIGDIWGITIENGGFIKYLAAVDKLLMIEEGNTLQTVSTEQGHTLSSVWGKTERLLYTAGGFGVALYKNYKWENMSKPDVNTIYNVRGQAFNEVFGLSSTFSILHLNGYSWQYINTGTTNIYYR